MDKNKELNIFYFISEHIKEDSMKNLINETDNLWNLFELSKDADFFVYGSGYKGNLTLWSEDDDIKTKCENLNKIIKKIISLHNGKDINLYLGIHDNHFYGFLSGKNEVKVTVNDNNLKYKIHDTESGNDKEICEYTCTDTKIKNIVFHIFQHGGNTTIEEVIKKIVSIEDINLKDLKSAFVPDFKKKIIELKHKLIALWLPLAIDIQGLSEVINNSDDKNNRANDYWNTIKGSNVFATLLNEHNKLINVCNDFLEKYKELKITVNKKNERELKNFIETLDKNNITVNVLIKQNYLNPDKDFFLPVWLKKYATVIDQRIEHYKR